MKRLSYAGPVIALLLSVLLWGLLIAAWFLLAPSAHAQTITEALLVNSAEGTGSLPGAARLLGPVPDIGQQFHQAEIRLDSLPGRSCDPNQARFSISLFGGHADDVFLGHPRLVYLPQLAANNATSNLAGAAGTSVQAIGLFPYVVVSVSFSDPSQSCNYSVYYQGGLQPVSFLDTTLDHLSAIEGTITAAAPVVLKSLGRGLITHVLGFQFSLAGPSSDLTLRCATVNNAAQSITFYAGAGLVNFFPFTSAPQLACDPGDDVRLEVHPRNDSASGTVAYRVFYNEVHQ